MESIFNVVGLTLSNTFTLYECDDHCWAVDGLPDGHFKKLFDHAKNTKGFWKQKITAKITYDDLGTHNDPINGIVKEVFINGLLYKPAP